MKSTPTTFEDMINTWGIATFADDLGIGYSSANAMKQRVSVPVKHWPSVLLSAEKRGFALDTDTLLAISRRSIPVAEERAAKAKAKSRVAA